MCYFPVVLLSRLFLYSFVTHFPNVFQLFRCTYKPERVRISSGLELAGLSDELEGIDADVCYSRTCK